MHHGRHSFESPDIEPIVRHWEAPFDAMIDRLEAEIIQVRRHLHAHPEPSGEEVETTRFLQTRLEERGMTVRRYHSDAGQMVGLTADVTLGKPAEDAPLIGIRADIDALRIPDGKQVAYRSQNEGIAHACGHDAHAAVALGLALASSRLAPELFPVDSAGGLRLRFLFQPAEETSGGARWLTEQGAIEGMDAIFGFHVDPERPVGEVGIRYGVLTAFCDEVDFHVRGHGGHAARPHHTVDPIAACAQLVGALYQYLPRSVDSRNAAVFSVGQIAGGYAPNVIPEDVRLKGSLRTTDQQSRETLQRRIRDICHGVQEASTATIDVRFTSPLNAVINHAALASALETASRRILGPNGTKRIDRPSLGGEDFSVYLEHIPGALLRLGCAVSGQQQPFLHSPVFDLDERCLGLGMKILIRAAVLVTARPEVLSGEVS